MMHRLIYVNEKMVMNFEKQVLPRWGNKSTLGSKMFLPGCVVWFAEKSTGKLFACGTIKTMIPRGDARMKPNHEIGWEGEEWNSWQIVFSSMYKLGHISAFSFQVNKTQNNFRKNASTLTTANLDIEFEIIQRYTQRHTF